MCKELTNEWQSHGVRNGAEYAILTDEITKASPVKVVKSLEIPGKELKKNTGCHMIASKNALERDTIETELIEDTGKEQIIDIRSNSAPR